MKKFILLSLLSYCLEVSAQTIPAVVKNSLDSILQQDQVYRRELDAAETRYGQQSAEVKALSNKIHRADSINVSKVSSILDEYGWLSAEQAGFQGSIALFLVIQHAPLATQQKYLPMMRQAVADKKLMAANFALLEDRVLIRTGKKQIYGSQLFTDAKGGKTFLLPLEDPEHVDQRRAAIGLEPLGSYLKRFKIDWNIEEYKKQLPEVEALIKATLEKEKKQ
jgi:hypothetical protein